MVIKTRKKNIAHRKQNLAFDSQIVLIKLFKEIQISLKLEIVKYIYSFGMSNFSDVAGMNFKFI